MPYFLQHFAKNWVKTLLHGTLQKKLLISRRSTSFGGFSPKVLVVFHQMPYVLQHFAKNWVKTLKILLVVFHQNYFLLKIGSKPQCTVLCRKSCLFRGDRQVLVVFHQMPYFLQHFSKNWVKTLVHGTLQKKLLISKRSTSFGGFSPNALLFATFC